MSTDRPSSAIILVRAQNDWEHTFPVAYSLAQKLTQVSIVFVDQRYPIPVSTLPPSLKTFLVGEFGVSESFKYKALKFINQCFVFRWKFFRRLPHQLTQHLRQESLNLISKHHSNSRVVLCCDYTTSDLALIEAMKVFKEKLSVVKSVILPHSISNWKNKWTSRNTVSPQPVSHSDLPKSDLYIVTDRFQAEDLVGIPKEKIKVLGSARYSPQWFAKLDAEEKPTSTRSTQKTILLLLSKEQMNYNFSEVVRMVKMMKAIAGIQLVIKPHTRKGALDGIPTELHPHLSFEPTRKLFLQADLILFTATSAMVEPIHYQKPVLFLRKTTTNQIYFEDYFDHWAIDTCEQLYQFIQDFKAGTKNKTYSEQEREKFLIEFGAHHPQTLELYAQEIISGVV